MTNISPLNFVHTTGKFGDYDGKQENDLLKVKEVNGLLIFQIAKYKNSNFDLSKIKIDGYIYEVPNFLIFKIIPVEFNNTLIRKSLYFTRNVLQNKFFIPNNLLFPKSRVVLENYFN